MSEGKQMQADLLAQLERQLAAANARVAELESTLAAYDARGEYIALLEQTVMEYAKRVGGSGETDRRDHSELGDRMYQAKRATDSAVARVEGSDAF